MAMLTTDFDDHVGAKQEVDPCEKSSSVTVDDLSRGAREACFADDPQESLEQLLMGPRPGSGCARQLASSRADAARSARTGICTRVHTLVRQNCEMHCLGRV